MTSNEYEQHPNQRHHKKVNNNITTHRNIFYTSPYRFWS